MQERNNKTNITGRGGGGLGTGLSSGAGGGDQSHRGGGTVTRFLYKVEHEIKMGIFRPCTWSSRTVR